MANGISKAAWRVRRRLKRNETFQMISTINMAALTPRAARSVILWVAARSPDESSSLS